MMLGGGTLSDPYIIKTPEDLDSVRNNLTAHYRLGNDIDLIDYVNWNPIGVTTDKFFGSLDGDGYKISNLTNVEGLSVQYKGLFSSINNTTIINLGLENVYIRGGNTVSGLVAHATNSIIENCYVTGYIEGLVYIGAIVGQLNKSTIKNTYNSAHVYSRSGSTASSNKAVGGLVGVGTVDSIIDNSYSFGKVTSSKNVHSGLIGVSGTAIPIVRNSYWDIEASGVSTSLGGGIGKKTSELKQPSTYTDWDFESVWMIDNDYPKLRVFNKLRFNKVTVAIHSHTQPIQAKISTFKSKIKQSITSIQNVNTGARKHVKKVLNVEGYINPIKAFNTYLSRFKLYVRSYLSNVVADTDTIKKKSIQSTVKVIGIKADTTINKRKFANVIGYASKITSKSIANEFIKRVINVVATINPVNAKVAIMKRKRLITRSNVQRVTTHSFRIKRTFKSITSFIGRIKNVVTTQFVKIPTYKDIKVEVSYQGQQSESNVLSHDTLIAPITHNSSVNSLVNITVIEAVVQQSTTTNNKG